MKTILKNLTLVLGLSVFITTFIVSAPASLIPALGQFERNGIHYASINGTIWQGRLRSVRVRGTNFGDVLYALKPLSLLGLSPALVIGAKDGAVRGASKTFQTRERALLAGARKPTRRLKLFAQPAQRFLVEQDGGDARLRQKHDHAD